MKRSLVWVMLFLLFGVIGCDKLGFPAKKTVKPGAVSASYNPAVKGTVIAKVNNMPITLEELNQEIEAYNKSMEDAGRPDRKITGREDKIRYLKEEMVRRMLLYQAALDKGLERDPEVANAIEKTKQSLMLVEFVRKETQDIDVSSKEIEEYYEQYKQEMKAPQERKISEIVVATEQEAKDILIQLLQGGDFAALARERSIVATRDKGGDLGYMKPGDKKSEQFDAVAFADTLESGKTSSIFKGPEGYYLIKVEALRGGEVPAMDKVWDDIKRALTFLKQQQKIEELVGKLAREYKPDYYESEIK